MTFAIGDIHGCLPPLRGLIARIPEDETLVFLGDYIDRGPESREVISYLIRLSKTRPCHFLRGNHEQMLLKAVTNVHHTANWVFNGGKETLSSYGISLSQWKSTADRGALLGAHLHFFNSMPFFLETDTTIFVHAGVDVTVPDMSAQDPDTLMWIRERFFRKPKSWKGKPIVFGHTPTTSMNLPKGKILNTPPLVGIDTGCVYGGVLTAFNPDTGQTLQEQSDFSYLDAV